MSEATTPMMQQYYRIRRTLPPETLLMFRLGDFYEMFVEDAEIAASILNVALTKRNGIPMCGVPHHAAEGYLRKLIKAGKRVAICDQVGEPRPGQIVEREVTHIVSPGTVTDLEMLDSKRSNFLAAIHPIEKGGHGFAYLDIMSGDFRVTELKDDRELADELARVQPTETLVSENHAPLYREVKGLQTREGYVFLPDQAVYALREHFKVQSLDGFGCSDLPAAQSAAGALLHYLKELRRSVQHITRLTVYRNSEFMIVDSVTQANLELVQSRGEARDTSLVGCLDRTLTPMGARKLREWILHPLCDLVALNARQQMIADLISEPFLLANIRETLRGIRDLERTVGRLTQIGGNARDLVTLRGALEQIPQLKADITALLKAHPHGPADVLNVPREMDPASIGVHLLANLHELPHLVDLLGKAIVEEPPAVTKEGGIFRDGYYEQLDELRQASRDGKDWIAKFQQQAMDDTGIKSLKVRYTSVFGYFIEVTKANISMVPPTWHRKQTVATGERYITAELKEIEGKILGADERSKALEYEMFIQLREQILQDLATLQSTATAIATLDVLGSLAETARLFGYCRPTLTNQPRIEIVDGRHPVLDQALVEEKFVPNDVTLDTTANRLLILTGPNMAGKSTYIRQVALLVLLAQTGSWLPAKSAEIGIADRIFTRVGANDDLSKGQSTFMVEMNETANICNNATARSLIILDEIGRGTSTFDGLSIAWSVAEFLHDDIKCRTLFATHYHELTELEITRTGVKNYNVAVREWNDEIIFLRKIIKGGADKSYGIQVGRLAGLPPQVIARAKEILSNLEHHELNADGRPAIAETPAPQKFGKPRNRKKAQEALDTMKPQMRLF